MKSFLPVALILATTAPAVADPPNFLFSWGCEVDTWRGGVPSHCMNQAPGQLSMPLSVAVAPDGTVYVTEYFFSPPGPGRIQHFTANGLLMSGWRLPGVVQRVAVGPDGTVYVAGSTVQRFDPDGHLLQEWTPGGTVADITVDPDGTVLVLASSHVMRFTPDGQLLSSFGGGDLLTPGHLPSPQCLYVDGQERIHVLDQLRSLQVFDAAGTLLEAWTPYFQGGDFHQATGIWVDDDGTILLTEAEGVKRYARTGELLSTWTFPESPGSTDLARSAGGVFYVCGFLYSRVYAMGPFTAIRSDPAGVSVTIDGEPHVVPWWADWAPGTTHELDPPALMESDEVRSTFAGWADGGPRVRTVTVGDPPTSYEARYAASYRLTVVAGAGVSVNPLTAWMPEAQPFKVKAAITAPLGSVEWSGTGPGSYTGKGFDIVVEPYGPIREEARYSTDSGAFKYDFSLSASDADPYVNTAPATGGVRQVYLWMACGPQGLSAFEAGVSGSLTSLGFEPLNGVLNAGTDTHLLLAVPGCPSGIESNFLLGRWNFVEPPGGGTFCLAPSPNGFVGAVDCDPIHPTLTVSVGVRGFDSAGGVPCASGLNACGVAPPLAFTTDASVVVAPAVGPLHVAPNPFPDKTELRFSLGRDAWVRLSVYDVAGRLVSRLRDVGMGAGDYRVEWNGLDAAGKRTGPGIYFVALESGGTRQTSKLVRAR